MDNLNIWNELHTIEQTLIARYYNYGQKQLSAAIDLIGALKLKVRQEQKAEIKGKEPANKEVDENSKWISCKKQMPNTEVLLLTSSKLMIIGDFYNGSWRTHRSKWVEKDGVNVLESAYQFQDIIAWRPLPPTVWQPNYPAPIVNKEEVMGKTVCAKCAGKGYYELGSGNPGHFMNKKIKCECHPRCTKPNCDCNWVSETFIGCKYEPIIKEGQWAMEEGAGQSGWIFTGKWVQLKSTSCTKEHGERILKQLNTETN